MTAPNCEDVVERTVAAIDAYTLTVGWPMVFGVPGMPFFFEPDAQPFVDAVKARLGDGYDFHLVLAGCAMVTRLAETAAEPHGAIMEE